MSTLAHSFLWNNFCFTSFRIAANSFSRIVFKIFSLLFQKDHCFMLVNSSFATSFDFICYHEINSSSLVTCNWFLHCFKSRLEIFQKVLWKILYFILVKFISYFPVIIFLLDKNYLVFDVVEDSLVLFEVSFGFLFHSLLCFDC